ALAAELAARECERHARAVGERGLDRGHGLPAHERPRRGLRGRCRTRAGGVPGAQALSLFGRGWALHRVTGQADFLGMLKNDSTLSRVAGAPAATRSSRSA